MFQNKYYINTKKQKGFTLVEIVMVLSIASLLIAGTLLFFNNASLTRQTNDTLQEIVNVQQTIQSLFAGQPNYNGLNTNVVADSKQLPSKWAPPNSGNIINPFGGHLYVNPALISNQYTLELYRIPDTACVKIVTIDLGKSIASLQVGYSPYVVGRAMTPVEASEFCNSTYGGNHIIWTLF